MSTSYENYFYDDNNLQDYISETDETGEIYRIEDYTYNDDALLVRIDYFDANNEYLADNNNDYLIYDYDDSFRLISKKAYKVFNDNEVVLRSQSYYTYNEAGLLSSITFGEEHSDGTNKEYYLYDENNVLIRIDYKQYENITYQLYYYLELTYDQNGNKIQEDKFSYASIPEGYFYTGYTTWTYQSFVPNSNVEIIHSNNLTNYPNPFNPETRISFNLKTNNKTSLSIYNLKGQVVKTFNVSNLKVGNNELVWHGKDNMNQNVSSGIYFIKLQNGDIVSSKKIVLMK